MKIFTLLTLVTLSLAIGLAAACSTATNTAPANKTKTAANTTNTAAANTAVAPKKDDDVPAAVKAAMPDAQSFTTEHKDIPKTAIAEIEKEAKAKVPDTDHHSFTAFSSTGGARKQIGAATVVTANGKDLVVVYENKEGKPTIKEVRADGIAKEFLAQFAGKNHDAKFQVGGDLKANGVDDALAKAIAKAIQIDALTMQMLFGAPDKH